MQSKTFISVQEVTEELGVSKSYAYRVVKQLNEELKQQGYLTVAGRVNVQYFHKKYVTTSGTFKVPQKGVIRWQFIKMVTQENGAPYFALLIGRENGSRHKREVLQPKGTL